MMMILTLVAWVWGGDTVEDGDHVPLLVLPPYDYRIARCFLSNNLTSPANDSENLCWGENILGADVECEDLEDPYGYYKDIGCNKMSSDEDIGVALKKAKKCFFLHDALPIFPRE